MLASPPPRWHPQGESQSSCVNAQKGSLPEQANPHILSLIPDAEGFQGWEQIYLTLLRFEIIRCLPGKPHIALLSRANDESLCPWFTDMFGFGQRKHMRCAIDGFGFFSCASLFDRFA